MSGRTGFFYSSKLLRYKLADDHPFNPLRILMTKELLQHAGVLQKEDLIEPRLATREELLMVHDEGYVNIVEDAGLGNVKYSISHYGLGTDDTPVFENMHEATSLVVGATVKGAEMVMEGELTHAVNLSGGLHHAHRSKASGFCVYNDAAVAIALLQRKYQARVIYIDNDAHHGDGVQWMFYDDPNVLTISFHETGRYLFPGTGNVYERGRNEGYGFCFNMPLEPFTQDDSWIQNFEASVIPLVKAFEPDLIITQNGCDGHVHDPLTHLNATTHTYAAIPRIVHDLAHEVCDGRLVAIGGGGYDMWRVVPRAWAHLWAETSSRPLPEDVPQAWLDKWQKYSPFPLPTKIHDDPNEFDAIPRKAVIDEKNQLSMETALRDTLSAVRHDRQQIS